MPEHSLDTIGRYEIIRVCGRGGFATVYLGRDPYINRQLALKVSNTNESKGRTSTLTRLFQEAEAAGQLLHPNIVTIYDAGIKEPQCYIAMEYVEGTTLHKFTKPERLLPVADVLDTIIKVCHGLDYAHQRGVIHRDVKPSNILIGINGEIKIADFGLACFSELASSERRTVGTPSYMPPEQVRGEGSTAQSDLFSTGVILYQLLTGAKPWNAETSLEMRHKIVQERHIPLLERKVDLPPALAPIVDRCLEKDPAKRYRSGFELARDLEAVLLDPAETIDGKVSERVRGLRNLSFFEPFSDEEIAALLTIGTWLTHSAGETIVQENERGQSFYVLVTGAASVMVGDRGVNVLSRGDSFGEVSFLLDRKRTATVTALEGCELLRLNPKKIDILKPETQITLYRVFARTIAQYLVQADRQL